VVWIPDANLLDVEISGSEKADQTLKSVEDFVPEQWGLPHTIYRAKLRTMKCSRKNISASDMKCYKILDSYQPRLVRIRAIDDKGILYSLKYNFSSLP